MKLLILLLFPIISFSQSVTITIKDYKSKTVINSAMILSSKKQIATSDAQGMATIPTPYRKIQIVATGYDTTEVILGYLHQNIYLSKIEKQLKDVHIKPSLDSFAHRTIEKMIAAFPKLHPRQSPNYKFYIYSKLVADGKEDSISKPKSAIDSDVIKLVKTSKLFVWEKITEAKHDIRYGEKNTILASNMSGFKQPIYEMFALTMDEVNYLPWIFRGKNSRLYIFRYEGLDTIGGRVVYEINFFPQRKFKSRRSRSGFVYIDTATHAMLKYYGNTMEGFGEIENQLIDGYCYNQSIFIKQTDSGSDGLLSQYELSRKIKEIKTNNQFTSSEFRGNTNDISIGLNDKSSMDLLTHLRGVDTMDSRERNTFIALDTLIAKHNVYNKLRLLLALSKGYVKLRKINLSVPDALQYNQYEGFRLQLGGETNYEWSRKFYLNGYTAFGFKDMALKGSIGFRYLYDYYTQGQIQFNVSHDVYAVGRKMAIYEPPLRRISHYLNLFNNEFYYQKSQAKLAWQTDIYKYITGRTWVEYSNIRPFYLPNYTTSSMDNMQIGSVGLDVYYYPKSDYMTSSEGKFEIDKRPTEIRLQYGYHHPLNTTYINPYHTADISARTAIRTALGYTEMHYLGGIATASTPLFHLYEGRGGASSNTELWKTFGLWSHNYFATMRPGTFYSNYFSSIFLAHNLPLIRLSERKRLRLTMTYKALYGVADNRYSHGMTIDEPSKIYQEAGLEIHRILSVFGLGVYYRMGAYSQSGVENNLAFRLAISL